jgi:endosialidase-like protein
LSRRVFISQIWAGFHTVEVMETLTISTNCIQRSLLRSALLFVSLLIGCFGLLPVVQAVSPPPDGGYPGGNTADGTSALLSLTTGTYNTGVGFLSLLSNTEGQFNTAIGAGALLSDVGSQDAFYGSRNTAVGAAALLNNTTGSDNTAIGAGALSGANTGSGNIALGVSAGTGISEASGVVAIGSVGGEVSNSCFIGKIRDVTTQNADAIPVLIDSTDQLGTMSSSRRYKQEIKPMDKSSEAVLALRPVTFHYKSDKTGTQQFGLIAEEVAAVNPALVVRDKKGEIYTVRYEAVNAMLLNEFLKEHRKV